MLLPGCPRREDRHGTRTSVCAPQVPKSPWRQAGPQRLESRNTWKVEGWFLDSKGFFFLWTLVAFKEPICGRLLNISNFSDGKLWSFLRTDGKLTMPQAMSTLRNPHPTHFFLTVVLLLSHRQMSYLSPRSCLPRSTGKRGWGGGWTTVCPDAKMCISNY